LDEHLGRHARNKLHVAKAIELTVPERNPGGIVSRATRLIPQKIRRYDQYVAPKLRHRALVQGRQADSGVVGNRTLRVGQYVQAGTQLMAVVPTAAAYIVANYKETQLADVRPGQPVEISVDMYPGVTVRGHVDSVAPASGQQFALLPPDNATGNFTKIVQRIPVKIVLDPGSPLAGELRPGMSVYPTIETKSHDQVADTASAGRG
jgi:multidrug efflux pump subunit AcrA (membrane-fusion protein)